MTSTNSHSTGDSLNWLAIGALYAGVLLGLCWLLYWGEYRNASWLALIGVGGACTAYARKLEGHGQQTSAQWWKRGGATFYLVFFLWAGAVLFRTL